MPQVDLYAERSYVRETAKRNLYTGKTYNSVENISKFFAERGMPPPSGLQRPAASAAPAEAAGQQQTAGQPQQPVGKTGRGSGCAAEEEGFRSGFDGAASEVWPRNGASP